MNVCQRCVLWVVTLLTLGFVLQGCDSTLKVNGELQDQSYIFPVYQIFQGTLDGEPEYYSTAVYVCDPMDHLVYTPPVPPETEPVYETNSDGSVVACEPFEFDLVQMMQTDIPLHQPD